MKKIILRRKNKDLSGSDALMYIDGRYNLSSTIRTIIERNNTYKQNFPHKVADSFYFVGERLERTSNNITL